MSRFTKYGSELSPCSGIVRDGFERLANVYAPGAQKAYFDPAHLANELLSRGIINQDDRSALITLYKVFRDAQLSIDPRQADQWFVLEGLISTIG